MCKAKYFTTHIKIQQTYNSNYTYSCLIVIWTTNFLVFRKLCPQCQCKLRKSYFDVVQDSKEGFPNLCQVLDEVVRLSPTDQVIQSQTAEGNRKRRKLGQTVTSTDTNSYSTSAFAQLYVYLDSRTLHMLLVRFEITSCRISFAYLSTCQNTRHLHHTAPSPSTCTVAVCLQVSVRSEELRTMVLSVTSASQMLVMAWRMPRLGSNWYL